MQQQKLSLKDMEQAINNFNNSEKLKLMEIIINKLKLKKTSKKINWNELYGLGKGIWDQDAQEYVNSLREDRV